MSTADESAHAGVLSRRNMLLATTTIAAASAMGTATSVQKAVAQTQQASPTGSKPNILVIMGDDVGWFNIGAYHRGIMSGKTQTSTNWRARECCLLTIMPKPVAPPAGRTSSPVNCRYGPV